MQLSLNFFHQLVKIVLLTSLSDKYYPLPWHEGIEGRGKNEW